MKSWQEKASELAALAERSEPAGRTDELIEVSEGVDSNPIGMATITFSGARPGPRLWIQAQTHGDEPNSTEAILRLVRALDPADLSGTLVVAPAMHTTAFRHLMRESPLDGKNGNRIWGIDWTKLGHTRVFSYIWMYRVSEMIRALKPDLVIDMHDGGIPLRIVSHALYALSTARFAPQVVDLCRQSGMKVVWAHRGGQFGGSINDQMDELGFPCIMLEAGGTGMLVDEDVQAMNSGLSNVLRAIGMLAGSPEPRADEQLQMTSGAWVRAGRAGLLYPNARLGDRLEKGQIIAHVGNLFGNIIEEIPAPADGLLFGLRHSAVANVGDYIANVGQLSG